MASHQENPTPEREPADSDCSASDVATAMSERAKRSMRLAEAMTQRAQAMASADQNSRRRLAAIRDDMANSHTDRAVTHSPDGDAMWPPHSEYCPTCGFALLPAEDRDRCHRCRDENCKQAELDWEAAQTKWAAATEAIQATRRRGEAADAARRDSHVNRYEADVERVQQRALAAGATAEFEQREVEWEQAQTAWREAHDAKNERSRRRNLAEGQGDGGRASDISTVCGSD